MPIQPLKEVLTQSLVTLNQYQTGQVKQVKTNRPWLDAQEELLRKLLSLFLVHRSEVKEYRLENLKIWI